MAALELRSDLPPAKLAGELRCAFSGIVAGNVKSFGLEQVEQHGPYVLYGDEVLMNELDILLQAFISQGRMKIDVENYQPCWRIGVGE